MIKKVIAGISRKSAAIIGYISIYLLAVYVYKKSGFIEIWGYYGFNDESSTLRLITTIGTLCFLCWHLPSEQKISVISLHIALLIIIIPSFLLYACSGADNYFLWVTLFGYMAFAILLKGKYKFPSLKLSLKIFSQIDIVKIILVAVFGVILQTYLIVGTRGVNLDITQVYEFRNSTKDLLPLYLLYLHSWASKVMIPFCIVISLERQRYFYAIASVSFGVLLFSLTGHKSTLFLGLLIPLLYYLAKTLAKNPRVTFLILFLTINSVFIASFFDFHQEDKSDQNLIGTFLFRRIFLIPALLNSFYIETFGISNSFNYFTDKIPRFLGFSPINIISIPNIIGYKYFHSFDSNANTGWIGSGYAQAGFVGVLFYSIIMAFFCRIGDFFARKHGLRVSLCILVGPLITMIASSDTLTGLLTNGGILALIMLLILPEQATATERR